MVFEAEPSNSLTRILQIFIREKMLETLVYSVPNGNGKFYAFFMPPKPFVTVPVPLEGGKSS
jgi:hypothetical protein